MTGTNNQLAPVQDLLKRLPLSDRIGTGAGLLTFVAGFLPWYRVSIEGATFGRSYSASAWDVGFGGWFPVLLLTAVAALIVVRRAVATPPAGLLTVVPLAQMFAPPLAVLVILLRWLTFPGGTDGLSSAGAGFGLFVALLAALAGCFGGWLVLRDSATPNRS
jgi:hypothetical protein